MQSIEEILHFFGKNKKLAENSYMVECPFHQDDTPSLHLKLVDSNNGDPKPKLLVKDFGGCDPVEILKYISGDAKQEGARLLPKSVLNRYANGEGFVEKKIRLEISNIYNYRNVNGYLAYQMVRYVDQDGKKTFRYRRHATKEEQQKFGIKFVSRLDDPTSLILYHLDTLTEHRYSKPDECVIKCYAEDTEILTMDGWKFFYNLEDSDQVAQFSPESNSINFNTVKARQVYEYVGEMVDFSTDWCSLLVTPDHRMVYKYSESTKHVKDVWRVKSAELLNQNLLLPTSGILYDTDESVVIDPERVRLLAAFAADATINKERYIVWNFKKQRKIERLEKLLSSLQIPYKKFNFPKNKEWTCFFVRITDASWLLDVFPEKSININCLGWSFKSRETFINELGYWDGDFVGRTGIRFFTGKMEEADIVTRLAAITGYASILRQDIRKDRNTSYVVNLTKKLAKSIRIPKRKNYLGKVYCVTTDTGFVVVRRNGKTCVSGNCEGEKDADNLAEIGYTTTCNPFGAGKNKWLSQYTKSLEGLKVVLIPDYDKTGYEHIYEVYEAIKDVVSSIKIVSFGEKLKWHYDVTDWITDGGNKELLDNLIISAEELKYKNLDYVKNKFLIPIQDEDEKVTNINEINNDDFVLSNSGTSEIDLNPDNPVPLDDFETFLSEIRKTEYGSLLDGLCPICLGSGYVYNGSGIKCTLSEDGIPILQICTHSAERTVDYGI